MNYKELFKRLFAIITSPRKEWVEIATESPRRDVTSTYVYPLVALGGLAMLISALFQDGLQRMTIHMAMMEICSYCISLFGGFFLASYLFDFVVQKYLQRQSDMMLANVFVGYAMGVVFVADMLVVLFPQFFIFKWVLLLYVCYVVWEGCDVLLAVEEEKRVIFMAITSALIIFSPTIIGILFDKLSNLLG